MEFYHDSETERLGSELFVVKKREIYKEVFSLFSDRIQHEFFAIFSCL